MSARCLLADDHPALVVAIADFLTEHGYGVVGPAANGDRAVALARSERPELGIVDYRMPGLAGGALVSSLKEVAPRLRILVYTADACDRLVLEALDSGADGIVLKEAPLHDLLRGLDAIRAGRRYIDPALAATALGAGTAAAAPITKRERDVLAQLSTGSSHAEIGSLLGISVETVRTHLQKACTKLDASTRTQAVATALRLGLIE